MSIKKECPKCGKTFRSRFFVYNRLLKKVVCKRCDNKAGNNIFFIPKDERKKYFKGRVSKYNFTSEEIQVLIKSGRTWKDINSAKKYLRNSRYRERKKVWEEKRKIKDKLKRNTQRKKEFLEGLYGKK